MNMATKKVCGVVYHQANEKWKKNWKLSMFKTGSYGYTDSYGIYRQVDYIADKHGFRATIKTNEPGTANES